MSDPEGLEGLAALITSPRVITPSLTGGRHLRPDVEIPDLVAAPRPTARRAKGPSRVGASGPRVQRATGPEGHHVEAPRPTARRSKVTLNPEQDLWMRGVLADALRDGVRLSEGDVLKLALDRLRAHGAGWSDLQADLAAETKARTRRGI